MTRAWAGRPSATRERRLLAPTAHRPLRRGGLDRATVDEALCCAGRSFCCGCYNLRVIIHGRGGAVRSDARGSTAARARFRTALMPSWRRSCLCARGAAARAVFLRGAAMLGVWAMIRRGFGARARVCTALGPWTLLPQRRGLPPRVMWAKGGGGDQTIDYIEKNIPPVRPPRIEDIYPSRLQSLLQA